VVWDVLGPEDWGAIAAIAVQRRVMLVGACVQQVDRRSTVEKFKGKIFSISKEQVDASHVLQI
jgi:hypothetical protein